MNVECVTERNSVKKRQIREKHTHTGTHTRTDGLSEKQTKKRASETKRNRRRINEHRVNVKKSKKKEGTHGQATHFTRKTKW